MPPYSGPTGTDFSELGQSRAKRPDPCVREPVAGGDETTHWYTHTHLRLCGELLEEKREVWKTPQLQPYFHQKDLLTLRKCTQTWMLQIKSLLRIFTFCSFIARYMYIIVFLLIKCYRLEMYWVKLKCGVKIYSVRSIVVIHKDTNKPVTANWIIWCFFSTKSRNKCKAWKIFQSSDHLASVTQGSFSGHRVLIGHIYLPSTHKRTWMHTKVKSQE